jgi:predicted nucleic acid-binding protein
MIFADIPDGTSVFLDANTLVYYFAPDPALGPACRELLERISRQELQGVTSTHALSDVAHRLMTLEAMAKFGWPQTGIARRLRRHPADVQSLVGFRQAVDEVPQLGIQIAPISQQLVSEAADISQQTGLLGGDALLVAVMRSHGLTHLASHDADFDRVPGITRYAPV